jgi:hypothetical protein
MRWRSWCKGCAVVLVTCVISRVPAIRNHAVLDRWSTLSSERL